MFSWRSSFSVVSRGYIGVFWNMPMHFSSKCYWWWKLGIAEKNCDINENLIPMEIGHVLENLIAHHFHYKLFTMKVYFCLHLSLYFIFYFKYVVYQIVSRLWNGYLSILFISNCTLLSELHFQNYLNHDISPKTFSDSLLTQ